LYVVQESPSLLKTSLPVVCSSDGWIPLSYGSEQNVTSLAKQSSHASSVNGLVHNLICKPPNAAMRSV
jgi:ApbE superfamily uncharacterized protein (UPF0280 family)